MKIETDEDENEKMDADFEEGECLTTDYESDGSVMSNASSGNKKKPILLIPNVKLDSDLKETVEETPQEFDLKQLFKYDYYIDHDYLWPNPHLRLNLQTKIQNFTLEQVLRYLELSQKYSYADYVKELKKLYPNLEIIEENAIENLMQNLTVPACQLDAQNRLRAYQKIFISLAALQTENPGQHQCMYRSFKDLSQKYFESVYHSGLTCQMNWMEVSKRVTDELIDSWVVAGYNYGDMKTSMKELLEIKSAKKKEKKLQQIYDNLLDSLVEVSESMPPALKLHTFTKDTIYAMEEIAKIPVSESQ